MAPIPSCQPLSLTLTPDQVPFVPLRFAPWQKKGSRSSRRWSGSVGMVANPGTATSVPLRVPEGLVLALVAVEVVV